MIGWILGCVVLLGLLVLGLMLTMTGKEKRLYVPSSTTNKPYLVQDTINAQISADMLGEIERRYHILTDYLAKNKGQYPEYVPYIDRLLANKLNLTEASPFGKHTSYTVNKGEEIAVCLREKSMDIHNINIVMYVVIHELAHVACPEIGHTALFKKIFIFLLNISTKIGIYEKVDYSESPEAYCGITIRENLLQ